MPYVARLGVSHLYASPIATARPGSQHGYDVIDATRVNPELGGEEGLRALSSALGAAGLGLILDIVPNHMAADAANAWWADVPPRPRQPLRPLVRHRLGGGRQGPAADPRPPARRGSGCGRARARRRCLPLLLPSPARRRRRPGEPALAAGLVAQRRRSHQLAALLRHQRAGLPAHGGARPSRPSMPCRSACTPRASSTACASIMSMASAIPPPIAGRCERASGPAPGSWSRRSCSPARACRPTGAATAPPATTSWTR